MSFKTLSALFSGFSLFVLFRDLFRLKLSSVFQGLVDFWYTYPVAVIAAGLAFLSIELPPAVDNLLTFYLIFGAMTLKGALAFIERQNRRALASCEDASTTDEEREIGLSEKNPPADSDGVCHVKQRRSVRILNPFLTYGFFLSIFLLWLPMMLFPLQASRLVKRISGIDTLALIVAVVRFRIIDPFYSTSFAFLVLFALNYAFL